MDTHTLTAELAVRRLVPVVVIDDAADAPGLGRALVAGGLPLAEVTFRTAAAAEAIAALRDSVPEILVGAGTVLDVATVDVAVASGAQFVVAPGFNAEVVDHCLDRGVPVVPGVSTPTEIEMGLSRGLTLLKFFPAEAAGGLRLLGAMSAPYRTVRFMPTGGISPSNLPDYLQHPAVLACGGSWLATAPDIAAHRFEQIQRRTAEAVAVADSLATPPTADRPLHPSDK
ncbi:MAG: bifunctional 4-hydroxy-2-oxoglutarate aldolase/2-dehydro-3-deoxy-phosphogluconate aldolase [Candidatus Nanopelagicales bacterium]